MDFKTAVKETEFWLTNNYHKLLEVDSKVPPPNVYIMKLETLNKDANRILNQEWKLKVKIDIPRINTSNHKHYASYYNRETIKIVYDAFDWCYKQGFYKKKELPILLY